MDQTHYLEPRSSQEIITLFKSSRLIPFFGSGFTKDSRAKKGKVPDAASLTKIITETASTKPGLTATQVSQLKSIKSLKSAFGLLEMKEYIPPKSAQTLLTNVFSEVKLSNKHKQHMLSIDWPHIFTFNIDDAIEQQNSLFKIIQPNKKISREYIAAHNCLFKVHGDITEYASNEDTNLIFTWRHYSHSIATNKAILSFISEEARDSAFLFIGCSLDAELDLIHLSKETPFKKSIFIKKGPLTIEEEISIKDYGINRVIYFDDYDQIYEWIFNTLKGVKRESITREIEFDENPLAIDEAKIILSNGGPLYKIKNQTRIARASITFTQRTLIEEASAKIRRTTHLLVTGRRFSGKTLFLFQIMLALKEYSAKFFGSSDPYNPAIKRQIEQLENYLFVFDSNHLDSESLDDILNTNTSYSSKIIICASNGDAERVRFKLSNKHSLFEEIKLSHFLIKKELDDFNKKLANSGLPVTHTKESLMDYAFRCHEEYKATLPKSVLFERSFKDGTYLILAILAAFGKAKKSQIDCISDNFDLEDFVRINDRVFDIEISGSGEKILVCSASAWLLKIMHDYFGVNSDSHKTLSKLIRLLENGGFSGLANNLIRFDKINEISGGQKSRMFIKKIYEDIADLYSLESHYWLQRAKAELISAQTIEEIKEGISHAQKVRLDNSREKNSTYYSATLVLAQIHAKAYKITGNNDHLLSFITPCIESIENHQHNKEKVNEMINFPAVTSVIQALIDSRDAVFLSRKHEIQQIDTFIQINSSMKAPSRRRNFNQRKN